MTLIILLFFLGTTVAAETIPVEHFAQLPMVEMPTVTPNGEFVAAILNNEEGPTVVVSQFGSRELTGLVGLKYGRDRIEWIAWANNDRLLISISEPLRGTARRDRVSRLYQVSRDGGEIKQIRRKEVGDLYSRESWVDTDLVLSTLPDDPEHILMQLWDARDNAYAVFRVNIVKNSFDKLFPNIYDVDRWIVDGRGNVILGIERYRNTITTWYRPDDGKKWQVLNKRELFEDNTFDVVDVSGTSAIVISDFETGYQSAWRYDLETGSFESLLCAPEGHDISGTILANDRSRVIGFSHIDHYREDYFLDAEAAIKYETVKQTFPGYATSIAAASDDMNRLIVTAQRDDSPPKYVWMDLAQPAGGVWYAQYPHLEGKPLASKQPIEFETADGLHVEGYLTLPLEPNGTKPSLIVFPHGGPAARDSRYFDPWVQFLANRGHAVLQVNFRGSEGFGSDFEVAGYRQFGRKMQEDVYEGIAWLEKQELVDAGRMCIVGFSYGGYVALTAAFQRPDDFACVASFAGIADLYEMVELGSLSTAAKMVYQRTVGDIDKGSDREMMKEVSPINHLEKIKAPLLMIHGTEDTRVGIKQSRVFVNKARAEGLDVEYIEIEDGTHFLDEHHNRLTVFEALDRFLGANLRVK